ncbi:hypothetical protein GCM10029976_087270 [Kribbella albertanoniae]
MEKAQRQSSTITPAKARAMTGNRKYCSANTYPIVAQKKISWGLGNLPGVQGVFTNTTRTQRPITRGPPDERRART